MSVRTLRLTAIVGIVAALAACAPGEGTVVAKHHQPAYSSQPHRGLTVDHLECWALTIRDTAGHQGDMCVPVSVYRRYQVGDRYPKGADR